jgi:uncharacterized protein (TIGR00297 family)
MAFLTLNFKGTALTVVLGLVFLILGSSIGYFFVLDMLLFLALSAGVTAVGIGYKKRMVMYQATRGVRNVLANGLPPLILAIAFSVSSLLGSQSAMLLSAIGFTASVAAITADKFASELGIFGGMPKMIFTFKKVRRGTSGGISPLGLAVSLLASFIIAATLPAISYQLSSLNSVPRFNLPAAIVAITIAGFIGCIVDSMMGFYEEKGIGNKYTSNFVCGLSGAAVAILILMLL